MMADNGNFRDAEMAYERPKYFVANTCSFRSSRYQTEQRSHSYEASNSSPFYQFNVNPNSNVPSDKNNKIIPHNVLSPLALCDFAKLNITIPRVMAVT